MDDIANIKKPFFRKVKFDFPTGQGGSIIYPMGCHRCDELFKLAEEAIEVHAQVDAQLAIAELERSRIKAKRLRSLAKTTGQTREWAAAAYRTHADSHSPGGKMKRAGSG